jgi:2-haloacid dehalogenase
MTAAPPKHRRPSVVAFDVVGTLFSLDPLDAALREAGLRDGAVGEWFGRFLRDAMALDAARTYVPFRPIAAGTLEVMLAEQGRDHAAGVVDRVLGTMGRLPAQPQAREAFEHLRQARIRIIALTNGSAETTTRLLQQAALEDFVERVISIDEVQRWKPCRDIYLHAAKVVTVVPSALCLVAAHAWDIQGARQAGLTTAWVSHKEKRFHPAMGAPALQGEGLEDVARQLAALPA